MKRNKGTNNDVQNITQKTKDCKPSMFIKYLLGTIKVIVNRRFWINYIMMLKKKKKKNPLDTFWNIELLFTWGVGVRVRVRSRVMVFNDTVNNISVISWRSVLLVLETLSHNVVSSTSHLSRIRTHSSSGDRHWLHR
jgi:hypothetical protein